MQLQQDRPAGPRRGRFSKMLREQTDPPSFLETVRVMRPLIPQLSLVPGEGKGLVPGQRCGREGRNSGCVGGTLVANLLFFSLPLLFD